MKTIKARRLMIAIALTITLGPIIDVYAGPGNSKLKKNLQKKEVVQDEAPYLVVAAAVQESSPALAQAISQVSNNALLDAIKNGNETKVQEALAAGTHVNQADKENATALMKASSLGNIKIVQMLLEYGAHATINQADQSGWTALTYATYKGHPDIVRMLVFVGSQLDYKDRFIEDYTNRSCMKSVAFHARQNKQKALHELKEEKQLWRDLQSLSRFTLTTIHRLCCDYAAPYCQDPLLQQIIEKKRIKNEKYIL